MTILPERERVGKGPFLVVAVGLLGGDGLTRRGPVVPSSTRLLGPSSYRQRASLGGDGLNAGSGRAAAAAAHHKLHIDALPRVSLVIFIEIN